MTRRTRQVLVACAIACALVAALIDTGWTRWHSNEGAWVSVALALFFLGLFP